jgi:glycosyltransferase involved in cell wall biosynthesis
MVDGLSVRSTTDWKSPKISILAPMFNEASYVREMLSSLQSQSFENWELLVVDDGSSDQTAAIIQDASMKDPRVRLVSSGLKLGKVKAFNLAFRACTGSIIMILGGDDVLPPNGLGYRVLPFLDLQPGTPSAAFFKLSMFSSDPRFDGIVLPRGSKGSRSGPCLTLNRALAEMLFPIPCHLPSEDIWLGDGAEGLAEVLLDRQEIVVYYRVHGGNSNPRHKSFAEMSDSIHARMSAWNALLSCERFELSAKKRRQLGELITAENLRFERRTMRLLLRRKVPIVDRLAMASMSQPLLFGVRTRFYKTFSGRRGR